MWHAITLLTVDLPVVISTDVAAILDPHKRHTGLDRRGWDGDLDKFLTYEGHASCFHGIFGLTRATRNYNATLFRFALRRHTSNSEIVKTEYPMERVRGFLYDSFIKEAPIIMLFLKYVQHISLYDNDQLVYKVSLEPSQMHAIKQEREALIQLAESGFHICSLRVCSMTIKTEDNRSGQTPTQSYHWLVMNMIGSTDYDILQLSQELEILPWVGVAAPLPQMATISNLALPLCNTSNISSCVQQLQPGLRKVAMSLPWCEEAQGHSEGHVFCFLPLPTTTHLPINIHGYFAVSDNRRSIEWPASDNKSHKALWNKALLEKHVAPLYSILLACRTHLVKYAETPLPILSSEGKITDPYAAWPLISKVRYQPIWNELVRPALQGAINVPLLWSPANNGRWVCLNEAFFLPVNPSFPLGKVAIEVLIKANIPVVSLPNDVRETLVECGQHFTMSQRSVQPTLVRQALKMMPPLSFNDKDSLQSLLECVMYDITQYNYNELVNLKLLPLNTSNFRVEVFKQKARTNDEYVFVSDYQSNNVLKFLPGIDSKIMDTSLCPSVQSKMTELAQWQVLQLRILTPQVISSYLLSKSIQSWCSSYRPHQPITWCPDRYGHPSAEWISDVWTWLSRHQTTLPSVVGLPLVPQQLVNSTSNSNVTLLPLPPANSGSYFVEKDGGEALLANMLRKMHATVVSYNTFLFSHPSISQYILQINIQTVLQYINNTGISVISSLNNDEKNSFRVLIAQYYYSRAISFVRLITQLPIFEVGVGANPIQLASLHFRAHVLPETQIKFDPSLQYPPNILSNREPVVVMLINKLGYGCQNNETLFTSSILPFALQQCKASSCWSNGDELIVWMLNKINPPPKSLLEALKSEPFIRTKANPAICKTASQLFNIKNEQFEILYDSTVDPVFPDDIYWEKEVMSKLMRLGIVSWSSLINDPRSLVSFMKERAESVQLLRGDAAIQRSCYLLELIATNPRLTEVLMSGLQGVRFVAVESSPPENYPSFLQWAGAGKKGSFDAPCNICHHKTNPYVIGSVVPVLSSYYIRNQVVCPPKVQGYFYSPSIQDVIKQLQILVNSVTRPITNVSEADKVSQLIHEIYSYLNTHYSEIDPFALPPKWIWWPNEQGYYMFMPTSAFVLRSPLPLNPLVHTVSSDLKMSVYGNLFARAGMRKSLSLAEIVDTLKAISSKFPIGQLPDYYLKMAIKIVKYLQENKYESSGDVLLPTTENNLCTGKDCTYDDREWIRERVGAGISKYKFVHGEIPPVTARYFGVEPLSKRVAPSEKLKLTYTKAGPKERVTRRISGIVNDYSGNIDVFKELIQNADDAGATEIKLLLDWRTHGKEYLFEKEMEHWQGPAVVAYNNATFSDQDFDNICELAAETKMKDPMKTGQFGVGFCASYSLTDVPSFVSRHFITIFDPHTNYLGDRVSHNEPGMRINLVEEREGLAVYADQFSPFNGLFGCNIFQLSGDGFNGTIFRFPLRMSSFPRSEISNERYDRYTIEKLMKDLQKESSNLLLFLKHITSLEVLTLEEGAMSPKEMKLQFQIHKHSVDHQLRIQLMRNPHLSQKPVCSTCSIKVVDNVNCKDHMSQYVIASALSTTTGTKSGLVPLAELAIYVSNDCPQSLQNEGCLFCFLPLPLGSYLPFHVNGFFDVGKDRRGLKEADRSPEYHWNMSLIQNALPLALEYALSSLCKQMNLSLLKNDAKETCLKQYYSLWPGEYTATTGTGRQNWITQVFSQSVKQVLSNSNEKLVWSEINGGKWINPQSAFLFIGGSYLPEEIRREAIQLLLSYNYSIAKCPHHIHQLLKASLDKTHLFNYERFFKEIFLPNISSIDVSIRNKHLLFVLTKLHEEYYYSQKSFSWAIQPLKSTFCIPVDITGQLVRPEELIDIKCVPIAKLYDPEEGRFPDQNYQKTAVMSTLTKMGMITGELPIEELIERAQQVDVIGASDETKANEKMIRLLEYIYHIEKQSIQSIFLRPSAKVIDKRKERITALANIPFLRSVSKPVEISIPWCTTKERFLMPSQLLSPQYFALTFTKKPLLDLRVTDDSMEVEKVVEYLGIDNNHPTVDNVLDHLCCLIEHFEDQTLDKETSKFLEKQKIFPFIYEFLQKQTEKEAIKDKLSCEKCIWQNGRFLSPKQVLCSWEDKQYYPYLCSLSDSNLKYAQFFEVVGVMREATLDYLITVLESISKDYLAEPLPKELLEFVIAVLKPISNKISSDSKVVVLLPDQEGVLRPASEMTCDGNIKDANLPVFDELSRKHYSTHENIPRKLALDLGAYPILEYLMKDLEDENFLGGIDFGPYEEIVDRLNGILKKYPADTSIFREFIQNADDAQATEIVFVLDHRSNHPDNKLLCDMGKWKKLQSTPALCIYNNRPFSDEDIEGISRLGRGGKGDTPDTIGRFGIGFNVAYHITDCPSFVSFNSQGIPRDYCVFDPLRKYCVSASKNKKQKPGRRWTSKQQRLEQMSDQFQPYLKDQFLKLKSIAPSCISDQSHGYSVFRLPLTRWIPPPHKTTSLWLKEGRAHYPSAVQKLFEDFKDSSENMLFFLNHLKHISVFEIMSNGNCHHHFTTNALEITESLSITVLTLCHHTTTFKPEKIEEHKETQWLINKQLGFPAKPKHLATLYDAAKERGLKAFGGTATQLNGPTKGSLFCSLPMNISSCLPVHLNGDFLVNDARNHLSKLPGLEEWNTTIAEFIIVPSYVDLILRARSEFDGSQETFNWFYGLFPHITSTNPEITEASELRVDHLLYKELLKGNQPILIDACNEDSVNWLQPSTGYFCVSQSFKTSEGQIHAIQVYKNLKEVLLSLGMPITNAPDYIFRCFCAVLDYASVGLVTPKKVIQFLKDLDLEEEQNEEIVKNNIELLLQFCIQNCSNEDLVSILEGAPILLTQAETLSTQTLFSSQFSHLLPHCLDKFIHPSLDNSKLVGKQLKEGNIIIPLPLHYVSSHIQLSDVDEPTKLSESETKLVSMTEQFYRKVLSEQVYISAQLNGPKFYERFIIPNIHLLSNNELIIHMEHICFQWQRYGEEWDVILKILKTIPCIPKQGKRYKACMLYDPDVTFHATFHRSKLPPEEWCKETQLKFLRELGLQCDIEYSLWLNEAKKVGEGATKLQRYQQASASLIQKSETLTTTLKQFIEQMQEKINENPSLLLDDKFKHFLIEASKIPFIYCPAPCELEALLEIVTEKSSKKLFHHFVQFHEAAYHSSTNLAGLFRSILPESCVFLEKVNPIFSQLLSIREPLNVKTVTRNLSELSKALSQTRAQVLLPTNAMPSAIKKLKHIFEEHYKFLEENLEPQNNKIVKELQRERCILLSPDHFSFLLVQPNQLIFHIPQEYNFSPFCYSAPPELLKYGKLLEALGIQQNVTPQQCIEILANIKGEIEKANKTLSDDQQFLNVCESAYKCLVECLRNLPEQPRFPNDLKIYLPSESLELIESSQLMHNDAPWLATRLKKSEQLNCKFLFPPPPDKNGQKIPPSSLQVRLISERAIEKLHSAVKSKLYRCTDQELYEMKKHRTNCSVVQALEDTFKSQELKFGLCRLFWHKIQKHPNTDKEFCLQMQAMKHLKIFCVKEIKTVIHFDKKEAPETEDNSRLCYLIREDTKLQLYITHEVSHFRDDSLFEGIAMELNKYFKHRVGDATNIKAILQCYPSDIPSVLDKHEISPFDPKIRSIAEATSDQEIGSELPFVESAFECEDLLVICNYKEGEKVVYHYLDKEGQPVFKNAKVMECPIRIKTEEEPIVECPVAFLDNRCVKLQIGTTPKGEPITKDASFLQVYKLLNTSQRTTLSSGQSSSFATPLVLASLPLKEEKLYKWIKDTLVYNTQHCCCSLSVLSLRMTAHLHYILVTREVDSDLFLKAAKIMIKIIQNEDIYSHKKESEKAIKEIQNLIRQLDKLSLEDDEVCGEPQSLLLVESIPTSISYQPQSPPIFSKRKLFSTLINVHTSLSSSQPAAASTLSHIPAYKIAPASTFGNISTGGSRVNQGFYSRLSFMPLQHQNDDQAPPKPKTSTKDAEMWLQQAKADYLAARNLYMCQRTEKEQRSEGEDKEEKGNNERLIDDVEEENKPDEEEQVGDESDRELIEGEEKELTGERVEAKEGEQEIKVDEEEEEVRRKPDTQIYCKFPALVCFLSHDVVEKCIIGIMYAKCGLPTHLLESSHLLTLCEQLEKSDHCTPQLKNVVKECVLRVNEHGNKSRYPNYQVPPCAPASIYTSLEAEEALRAAHRLILEIKKDDVLGEIIGDLENLPEQRFSSLLSVISEERGKNGPIE